MSDPVRRVLVTGAAGLLGRAVVADLSGHGLAVTGLDRKRMDDLPLNRTVVGSAEDVNVVRERACECGRNHPSSSDPVPDLGTPEEVFCGNTRSTFNVLEQAAQAGVRRAVIASSYSVTGLTWACGVRHPAYVPIDEHIPLQIEDPYGLSKQVDELIAGMMWWRHGLSVVALRFPFLGTIENELPARAERITDDPAYGAREFWTYLETRDAARACVLALTEPGPGFHVVAIAAPNTLAPYPTSQLLDVFHPDVPRRAVFDGRISPVDLGKARWLLNWSPEHVWMAEERGLDEKFLWRARGY